MDDQLKTNIANSSIWIRLVFMLLFGFVLYVAMMVLWPVVVVQFLFALITGEPNKKLAGFASSLSQFIQQCIAFETFASEEKPFPFSDFPQPQAASESVGSAPEIETSTDK